jgi:hypothetical protein
MNAMNVTGVLVEKQLCVWVKFLSESKIGLAILLAMADFNGASK